MKGCKPGLGQACRSQVSPLGVALAVFSALVLLCISLLAHGPAWLADSALSLSSGQTFAVESAEGLWHAGTGRLRLTGAAETLPFSWRLERRGAGVVLQLGDGLRGELACDLRLGCSSAGLAGSLPGSWLVRLAPPLGSVGLEASIDWQLRRLQWGLDGGGSLALDWHGDAVYAARLGLPLGWYAGTLEGQWSAAEREPRLSLQLQSSPPAGVTPPLEVRARGHVGGHSVELSGQVGLPANADPRYARLLQMLGLTPGGGAFKYRGG